MPARGQELGEAQRGEAPHTAEDRSGMEEPELCKQQPKFLLVLSMVHTYPLKEQVEKSSAGCGSKTP